MVLYILTVLGSTCNIAADCAGVTNSSCDNTCKCAFGFVQDAALCKIGKLENIMTVCFELTIWVSHLLGLLFIITFSLPLCNT